MQNLIYSAITSLIITFLVMPLFVKFLQRIHVMDQGGRRKIHKGVTPSMGGAVVFVAFLCALLLWFPEGVGYSPWRYVTSALVLMALIGVRDDVIPISALIKFITQLVAASLVVIYGKIYLHSFYGLFGIYELPEWFGMAFSIVFVVFITNAFNLIDGIDGLAGSIAFVVFTFLALWNYWVGNHEIAVYLACFIGAIVGFLYYNWQPASIFLGDTGSLVTGMLLALSTLKFIEHNGALVDFNPYKLHAVLSAGVALVLLPMFDTIRVFIQRILKGQSPFTPDKRHVHHAVLRRVHTHARATRIIVGYYILVAAAVLFVSWRNLLPDWIILLALFVVLLGFDRYINYVLLHLHKEQ